MATTRASSICLRRLSTTHFSRAKPSSAVISPTAQRHLYTPPPPPLFLDFLAPSCSISPRSPQRVRLAEQTLSRRPQNSRRQLSTTRRRQAKAITNPRTDDAGAEMTITITPRAAHRLQAISDKDGNPDLALRVAVESGGCHGFQYLMSLVDTKDMDVDEDTLFENEEGRGDGGYRAKVVMDEPSLELLKGSSIDYTMELIGSQFKVTGIPGATSSCGCGTSFDVA